MIKFYIYYKYILFMGPCSAKTVKEQPLNLDLVPFVTEGNLGFNVRVSNIKLKIDNLVINILILVNSLKAKFKCV